MLSRRHDLWTAPTVISMTIIWYPVFVTFIMVFYNARYMPPNHEKCHRTILSLGHDCGLQLHTDAIRLYCVFAFIFFTVYICLIVLFLFFTWFNLFYYYYIFYLLFAVIAFRVQFLLNSWPSRSILLCLFHTIFVIFSALRFHFNEVALHRARLCIETVDRSRVGRIRGRFGIFAE